MAGRIDGEGTWKNVVLTDGDLRRVTFPNACGECGSIAETGLTSLLASFSVSITLGPQWRVCQPLQTCRSCLLPVLQERYLSSAQPNDKPCAFLGVLAVFCQISRRGNWGMGMSWTLIFCWKNMVRVGYSVIVGLCAVFSRECFLLLLKSTLWVFKTSAFSVQK